MILIINSFLIALMFLVSLVIMHIFHTHTFKPRSAGFVKSKNPLAIISLIYLKLEYLVMRLANNFILGKWSWFFRSRIKRFIFEVLRHLILKLKTTILEPYTIEESISIVKNIFREHEDNGKKLHLAIRTCPCRLAQNKIDRGKEGVSNCTDIVFLTEPNILTKNRSFMKFISLDEVIQKLKKFENEGLVHSFLGVCSAIYGSVYLTICNCNKEICLPLLWYKKKDFRFYAKPHNIAVVDLEKCTGCGNCVSRCPINARKMVNGKSIVLDHCFGCGTCRVTCEGNAITMVPTKNKPTYFQEYMIRKSDGSYIS
ncbi:MAG: 4Fe-4S binding protein [Candidatus Helarchaeota archaeon]